MFKIISGLKWNRFKDVVAFPYLEPRRLELEMVKKPFKAGFVFKLRGVKIYIRFQVLLLFCPGAGSCLQGWERQLRPHGQQELGTVRDHITLAGKFIGNIFKILLNPYNNVCAI